MILILILGKQSAVAFQKTDSEIDVMRTRDKEY